MLSNMAYQTNLYTTQKNVKSINTDAKELEQLTGVYLRMGLVKMPNQRSYWETFSVYTGVSSIFSRKRFETLMSSIHFVDNNSVTEETKKNKKKQKTNYENRGHGFPVCDKISWKFLQKNSMLLMR